MNRVDPKKLLGTKWSAAQPVHKELHFLVSKVYEPDDPNEAPIWIEVEAVYSNRVKRIAWRDLQNEEVWKQGWV